MFKLAVPELVDPEDHVSGDSSPNFKPLVEHRSDQEWTFRRTYYYTHGYTSEKWLETVQKFFESVGYLFIPSDHGRVRNNWPKESFFFVRGRFEEIPTQNDFPAEEPSPELVNDVNNSVQVIHNLNYLMTPEESEEFQMILNWLSDDEDYELVQKPLGDLSVKLIQRETDQVSDLDDEKVQEEVERRYADDNFYMTKLEAGHYTFIDTFDRTWELISNYPDTWAMNLGDTCTVFTTKRSAMKHMLECIIRAESQK
jgi:hypothetical protein